MNVASKIQRCQNVIQGFGVTYLITLEREWRGYKITVGGYCTSQTAIFYLIFDKFNYIF